ncbi:MAG TPA: hypothetical protein VKT22_07975 [Steroidobacteraceae bacterium]|nr:hypothetical protein [Steroidobacteraceae bacterium]
MTRQEMRPIQRSMQERIRRGRSASSTPTPPARRLAGALLVLLALSGCHRHHEKEVTPADVASAQQDARREIEQAQAEARKDVRSAAKVSGGDSRTVAQARVTGTFDVAMAQADGDHKVALQKCQLLEPAARAPCQAQADSEYESAVSRAKAARQSRAP